jgi:hypothetical protein
LSTLTMARPDSPYGWTLASSSHRRMSPGVAANARASTAYSFGEHGTYPFEEYSRRTLRAIGGSPLRNSVSKTREGSAWETRLSESAPKVGDFRSRLLLALSRRLQALRPSENGDRLLDSQVARQRRKGCAERVPASRNGSSSIHNLGVSDERSWRTKGVGPGLLRAGAPALK